MREEISTRLNGSKRVRIHMETPSKTQQSFKQECDLNLTLKRFGKTRDGIEAMKQTEGYLKGRFEDVSAVPDFRTARDQINRSNAVFMALPAKLRKFFDNDPAQFLDYVDNPANRDSLIKMGLIKPPAKPEVSSKESAKPVEPGKGQPTAG